MQVDKRNIIIRAATEEDLKELYIFEQGVIATERPFDPTLGHDPIQYYNLPLLISSPDSMLVVAEYNARVVASGYARIEKSEPYLMHSHHAYLGFMFVHPDFRRQGLNELIITSLKEWAGSKGINELRLEVYVENHPAIRAYEKLGFSRHMIEMRFNLND